MQREAGFVAVVVLVLVLVAHEVYLAWSLARTRVRLLSLERFVRAELKRLAAVEQAQAPAATPAPAPAATPAPAPAPAAALAVGVTEQDDDDACTKVWTGPPAALVEAAARGANPSSQATPRAALSMDVAPRAAALPSPVSSAAPQATPRAFLSMDVAPRAAAAVAPPLSRAAQLAAGLERPKSTRPAPHAPPVRVRTETLAGMASPLPLAPPEGDPSEQRTSWPSLKQHGGAASTRPPAGVAPVVAAPRFAPTLLSMQAQPAPREAPTRRDAGAVGAWTSPKPGDDDGETTSALAFDPPMYGPRSGAQRPPPLLAPLADPSLIGPEERADDDERPSLGPDEPTPPRGVRAAPLLPVVQAPEDGA
jgi:hypothetical protein